MAMFLQMHTFVCLFFLFRSVRIRLIPFVSFLKHQLVPMFSRNASCARKLGLNPQWHSTLTVIRRLYNSSANLMNVSLSCVSFMFYVYMLFSIHAPLLCFLFRRCVFVGCCLLCKLYHLLVVQVVSPALYCFHFFSNRHYGHFYPFYT